MLGYTPALPLREPVEGRREGAGGELMAEKAEEEKEEKEEKEEEGLAGEGGPWEHRLSRQSLRQLSCQQHNAQSSAQTQFLPSGGPSDGMSYNQSCKNDGCRPPLPLPFPLLLLHHPPFFVSPGTATTITTTTTIIEKKKRLNLVKYYSILPEDV
ncbi:hypothetical protein E2C01_098214 [Portunus trituberculatus]|uniref:Uncharacterized protein n=1 Tax=Portunus trituberculatus TaxID=210409 RepID=A0A5B7K6I9_PORTR|nr:hypothetical protein [Portunus trituberculatus]